MLTAVITHQGARSVQVRFAEDSTTTTVAEGETNATGTTVAEVKEDMGPNPISPEGKELLWGGLSFVVLAVAIRFFLFPKLKKGMDDRYAGIRADHESADATTAAARGDVAEYEKALAAVRAEAAGRVDSARQTLDAERQKAITELNSKIAARRSEADAALNAAREANRSQITAAVSAVVTRATELSVGRAPEAAVVEKAIADAMAGGAR